MKNVLAALTIAAILAIPPTAMARGVKMPKQLCIVSDVIGARVQRLAFKPTGTLTDSNGKTKLYTVTGVDGWGIIGGTALIIPDTSMLRATYSGQYGLPSGTTVSYELDYDLETGSGTVYKRVDYVPKTTESVITPYDVTEIDCSEGLIWIGP